jgi:hypothetical protein
MSQHAPCPRCGEQEAQPVSFTWWGGVIGPRMLSHVKCRGCGCGYNGKTGRLNTTGIVIYSIVVFIIVAVLFYFIQTSMR